MSECVNNHQLDADHFACFSFVLATLDWKMTTQT